jgi:hypothetical protein
MGPPMLEKLADMTAAARLASWVLFGCGCERERKKTNIRAEREIKKIDVMYQRGCAATHIRLRLLDMVAFEEIYHIGAGQKVAGAQHSVV